MNYVFTGEELSEDEEDTVDNALLTKGLALTISDSFDDSSTLSDLFLELMLRICGLGGLNQS